MRLNLKIKTFGLTILTILLTSLIIGFLSYTITKRNLTQSFQARFERQNSQIHTILKNIEDKIKTYAFIIAQDKELIKALEKEDVGALEKILTSYFKELHRLDPLISTLEVTNKAGIVVMRGHNPQKRGDDKSKVYSVSLALQGNPTSGFEISPTTKEIACDAVLPVKSGPSIIGTLKVGAYLKSAFGEELKRLTQLEIAFYSKVGKEKPVFTTLKEAPSLKEEIYAKAKELKARKIFLGKENYLIGYHPLIGSEGEIKGILATFSSFKEVENSQKKLTNSLLIAVAPITISMLALSFILVSFLLRRINTLNTLVGKVTAGELDVNSDQVSLKERDEIDTLTKSFFHLVQNLGNIISQILNNILKLTMSSDNLRAKKDVIRKALNENFVRLENVTTAHKQMTDTILDIAKNITKAEEDAKLTMKSAEEGKNVLGRTVEEIRKVYKTTENTFALFNKLNQSVNEIGNIVSLIKDIADQTNLLALNASIEAARAGEAGKGFAVVANEVKNLAQNTIKATQAISEQIENIQRETFATTESMNLTKELVERATRATEEVRSTFMEIIESVEKLKDAIVSISSAVEEQSIVSNDVAKNLEEILEFSKKIEQESRIFDEATNNLTFVVEELRNLTSTFKTKVSEVYMLDLAKSDHRIFLGRIENALDGLITLDPKALADHTQCRFGKWYLNEGNKLLGHLSSFKAIDEPHKKFHEFTKACISAYNAGKKEEAKKIFEEMEEISEEIVNLLETTKMDYLGKSA